MTRKAIVIVPSEEDYKARIEAQEKAQCKDVPDNAVMEMKGIEQRIPNFLPSESVEMQTREKLSINFSIKNVEDPSFT